MIFPGPETGLGLRFRVEVHAQQVWQLTDKASGRPLIVPGLDSTAWCDRLCLWAGEKFMGASCCTRKRVCA